MKFKWSSNRDVVLYRMTLFAFSCPAVLEAAAHEKKGKKTKKPKDQAAENKIGPA